MDRRDRRDNKERRIDEISEKPAWKGSKPDKKKLDSLKMGEEWYDPETQTRYECIGKLSNGESITVARGLNVETI